MATPINEAEAIIFPLFDPGLFDHRQFTFAEDVAGGGHWAPGWDASYIKTHAGRFSLTWRGRFELTGYDRMRLFINFAPHLVMNGWAVVNGRRVELFRQLRGQKLPAEPTSLPLAAAGETVEIAELGWEWQADQPQESFLAFYWIGAVNTAREHLIEDALPKYASDWPGLLNPSGAAGLTQTILGSRDELQAMKAAAAQPRFAAMMNRLRSAAQALSTWEPENDIRLFVPCVEHLYRYVRVRDRNRRDMLGPIMLLSLAGWLCDRKDWSLRGARAMLSLAATPHWFEGPQGCFPGSAWHHVAFMEAHCLCAAAIGLQFLGDLLTPTAREKVLDRIAAAWELVDARCREGGYRWHMNQGIVFNSQRLLGAMALHRFGRGEKYAGLVEESYRDYNTVLGNYLDEHGHCTEGGYYLYSFGESIPMWLAYAEFKHAPLAEVLPERFKRSVDFVQAFTSTTSPIGVTTPLGAGGTVAWPAYMVALLATCCGWKQGLAFLANRQASGEMDTGAAELSAMDAMLMLRLLPQASATTTADGTRRAGLGGCVASGLLAYEFPGRWRGKLLLQCERPAGGHHHQDRGGIVLESAGRVLLPDFGTTNYADVRCLFMKYPEWHNLARPVGLPMRVADDWSSPTPVPRAKITEAVDTGRGLRFAADLAPIYGPAVATGTRQGELTLADDHGTLRLLDHWKLAEPRAIEVTFQSYAPWTIEGNLARTTIDGAEMTVRFAEASGLPLAAACTDGRIDNKLRPAWTLSLTTPPTREAKIESVIHFPV